MNMIFGIIFVLSIAGGAAWGYINNLTVFGTILSITAGGFIGSSIIAMVFTYLLFTQKAGAPKGPEQPEQKDESKTRKRLNR
ncbi:MAG TPA: hypothetical protein DHV36_14610 [Desulfobacteraceae bacterium]|nr:hypothetical protein [Desulfobacteraceae bacterium]